MSNQMTNFGSTIVSRSVGNPSVTYEPPLSIYSPLIINQMGKENQGSGSELPVTEQSVDQRLATKQGMQNVPAASNQEAPVKAAPAKKSASSRPAAKKSRR